MSDTRAALVARLRQIEHHDWRLSILAHVSDTAKEAADALAAPPTAGAGLREALKPFADMATPYTDPGGQHTFPDDHAVIDFIAGYRITVGDFRRARTAIAKASPEGAEPVAFDADYVLPCDVRLPPATTIRKGCNLHTLMAALAQRESDAAQETERSR